MDRSGLTGNAYQDYFDSHVNGTSQVPIDTPIQSTQNDIGSLGPVLEAGFQVPGVTIGGPP